MVTVQRAFPAKHAKDPSTDKTIRAWYKQFTETGCLCKQKSSGRPLTAEDDLERVWASFLHSPKKSTNISSCQKNIFSFPVAVKNSINPLTPNDDYIVRTAPLTSKLCILYAYSTNIGTEYFKHGIYSPFFPLQNAVCFINLTYLATVLFTFYIQGVLKFKKIIPAPKG